MVKEKKKSADKKPAKKVGGKAPKSIAGVKIPKDLRSRAARAKRYVEAHPVISEAVAAGMLAAAAALMDKQGGRKAKTAMKAAASAVGGRLMAEAKGSLGLGGTGKSARAKSGGRTASPKPRKR